MLSRSIADIAASIDGAGKLGSESP